MAISVDWATGVITVPKADLQLVQATPTEIRQLDINSFRLELKDLEDDAGEGISYTDTHNHVAPISVGGVTLARVVEILEPYTITFEDGQYQVNLIGANSNIADRTNLNQVGIRSANSAGLTFSEQINSQSFLDAAVYIDTVGGNPGSGFPRGTPTDPVDNLADASTIASQRNLKRYDVTGPLTFNASAPTGANWQGHEPGGTHITLAGGSTAGGQFHDMLISGQMNGFGTFTRCSLSTITDFNAIAKNCFMWGTITVASGAVTAQFHDCRSVLATGRPVIDLSQTATDIQFRAYDGTLRIINLVNGNTVEIDVLQGEIEIDPTCTNGTIIIRGGKVVDNGNGCNCIHEGTLTQSEGVKLSEMWQRFGLDSANPLTTTPSLITVDGITINLTGDGVTTSTATRQ